MKYSLRAIRANKGWTLEYAASEIGITPQTLSSWEKGLTYPRVNELPKIEKVYGVSYNDINFLTEDTVIP